MKKLNLTITVLITMLMLSGCTIKKTDSTLAKSLKHTANIPAYAAVAVVGGIMLTSAVVLTGAEKTTKAITQNSTDK